MNLKIKIEITNSDTDKVIWTDWASGDTEYQRGMFETAEMILGKMERHLPMVLRRDYPEEMMEKIDDEQMKHREAPTDAEMDAMYEASQTESEAYRLAH